MLACTSGKTEMSKTKLRIMVVDDSLEEVRMLEYLASVDDTVIAIRRGGISALEFLHRLDYEIHGVITDLSMPDMDGITLTEQIRRQERLRSKLIPIKIIWYTGWDYDENDENDPIIEAKNKLGVLRIYRKTEYDPIQLITDLKTIIEEEEA